ncbi:BZ3500_MvSof-1268-A1-R1_Chr4-1g06690 [Microbotryum saponariae]|uniref:Ribosomal RNA-processing protein 42 n=1 Tax=Microbotryum saponariae TaxID=289078 RepID=A0A2X0MAZ4_9BASI|nr:BZ3500_MvSof-1268-A1-R1_Chr4-1g06690 [Microbotryum saponariae]SDA06355.1 BZ3501_MvSof-1269-A2-R1_Chr4-1g06400 [Microbotryum saponariae]
MSTSTYSTSELSYTQRALASNTPTTSSSASQPLLLRADGRCPLSFRDIILTTNVSQAQGAVGSALACLDDLGGQSQVMAAVRAEVEDVRTAEDEEVTTSGNGGMTISIECSPTALPTLRPDLLPHLSALLTSLFSPSSLPPSLLSQLIIIPHSKTWSLKLDLLILASQAGNIVDLVLVAARSALATTRLPRTRAVEYRAPPLTMGTVSAVEGEGWEAEAGVGPGTIESGFAGLVKGGKGGSKAMDFELVQRHDGRMVDGREVEEDDRNGVRLIGWRELPIGFSLHLVNQLPFLDPTTLEEATIEASLLVGFQHQGHVCAIQMVGQGEVEVGRLMGLIKKAKNLADDLKLALNQKLATA